MSGLFDEPPFVFDGNPTTTPAFNGATYDKAVDHVRLSGQLARIYDVIRDGQWRTLREIADAAVAPESSVSAQLRHLRKERFGAHVIEKQSRGAREIGLFEYRLVTHV